MIVLKPGLSAQPLTGSPPVPTVSVSFKEGVVDVPEGPLTEMMLKNPAFGSDYVSADSVNNVDPFAYGRTEMEPQHVVTELKYGTPQARHVEGGGKAKLPPELAKIVQDAAAEMAKAMLPSMMETMLKTMVEQSASAKVGEKATAGKTPVKEIATSK